jgi:hypothetical protein
MLPVAETSSAELVVHDPVALTVEAPVMYKPEPAFRAPEFAKAPEPVKVKLPDVLVAAMF